MAGNPSKPVKPDPSTSKPSTSRSADYSTYYFALALAYLRQDPNLFDDSSSSDSDSDASMESLPEPDRVPLPGKAENPILIDDDDEPHSEKEEPEVIDPEMPPCGHCEGCKALAKCVAPGIPPPV